MKKIDLYILCTFIGSSVILFFTREPFAALISVYPIRMGFLKVAILATFGECMQHRITKGYWLIDKISTRFFVWGCCGVWFTLIFPFVTGGTERIIALNLWTDKFPTGSMSLWINILSGYGFFMMFVHYWINNIIEHEFMWPWDLMNSPQTVRWCKIVFISLFGFWLIVQCFVFSLDPVWRVLAAAYLTIPLGFILAIAESSKKVIEKVADSLGSDGFQ